MKKAMTPFIRHALDNLLPEILRSGSVTRVSSTRLSGLVLIDPDLPFAYILWLLLVGAQSSEHRGSAQTSPIARGNAGHARRQERQRPKRRQKEPYVLQLMA